MVTKTRSASPKQAKAQKAQQFAQELGHMQLLGEIICWSARADEVHVHSHVVGCLKAADLDSEVARALLPRHAFSRACKTLSDERVIDVLKEDGDKLHFQFTKKALRNDEWIYGKETTLILDKDLGKIECRIQALKERAQTELDKCMQVRTTSDITKIVQKLFDNEAELFPIRDQGGVYFVPKEHSLFISKIELFLHKLGGKVSRFPVPAGTQMGNRAVQDAVAESLGSLIQEHETAIQQFTINTRKDTMEHAADRIKKTRVRIEAHADYLMEKRDELLKSIDVANEKLVQQINRISQIKADAPPKAEGTKDLYYGHSMTAVLRWMGKEQMRFDQAKRVLNGIGASFSDATVRAQLLAGRKGERGDPAALTKEQAKELWAKAAEPCTNGTV